MGFTDDAWSTLEEFRTELRAQGAKLAALEADNAALRIRLDSSRRPRRRRAPEAEVGRRDVLRLGGMALAGAAAVGAGLVAGSAPAGAQSVDVVLGEDNVGTQATIIQSPLGGVLGISTGASESGIVGQDQSGANGAGVTGESNIGTGVFGWGSAGHGTYIPPPGLTGVYGLDGSISAGGYGVYGYSVKGTGVYGTTESSTGYGVYGTSTDGGGVSGISTNNNGVSGTTGGTYQSGVAGTDNSSGGGHGVYGNSVNGTGVWGQTSSTSGYGTVGDDRSGGGGSGLFGTSSSGYGASLQGGLAPLLLTPSGASGRPTSGTYAQGALYVDAKGVAYQCVGAGTPGTWRKLTAGAPTFDAASGSTNFLSTPIRLLNTPSGVGAPERQLVNGASINLQVTGVSVGGVAVPAGAVGVIGTVHVINTTGAGTLSLYPQGAAKPGTSNINWTTPKQVLATAAVVGLSSSGQLTLTNGLTGTSTPTDVVFDVAGFVF